MALAAETTDSIGSKLSGFLETAERLGEALFDRVRVTKVGKDGLSIGAVVGLGDLLEAHTGEHGPMDDCPGEAVVVG